LRPSRLGGSIQLKSFIGDPPKTFDYTHDKEMNFLREWMIAFGKARLNFPEGALFNWLKMIRFAKAH